VGTAVAVVNPAGIATIYNPGAHGFSEVLYAFSSAANSTPREIMASTAAASGVTIRRIAVSLNRVYQFGSRAKAIFGLPNARVKHVSKKMIYHIGPPGGR